MKATPKEITEAGADLAKHLIESADNYRRHRGENFKAVARQLAQRVPADDLALVALGLGVDEVDRRRSHN